jgi:RNA polymerase sigma-70 factor (ECF subfamily)
VIEQIAGRIRSGDRQALGQLFEQFRPRLRKYLQVRMDRRLAARASESDVLQEIYLDVTQQIGAYLKNPQVALYVWLRGLASQRLQKVAREHVSAERRSVHRERPLPARSSVVLARQLLAGGPSPSQHQGGAEVRDRVQAALASLKLEDREIILLREFEELSNSEVAEILELSDSAATMRYGRALFRLKELLKPPPSAQESSP